MKSLYELQAGKLSIRTRNEMPLIDRQEIDQLVSLVHLKLLDKLLKHKMHNIYSPNLKVIVLYLYKKDGKSSVKFLSC